MSDYDPKPFSKVHRKHKHSIKKTQSTIGLASKIRPL
jgi:hypothetical protein